MSGMGCCPEASKKCKLNFVWERARKIPTPAKKGTELSPSAFARCYCGQSVRLQLITDHLSPEARACHGVGRACGVGRGLGLALGVAVGVEVGLGVVLGVGVTVGVGVAVGGGVALGVGVGVGVGGADCS